MSITTLSQKNNVYLINSWYFDFEKMIARRDPEWLKKHPYGAFNREIEFTIFGKTIFKKCGDRVDMFAGFFGEPEKHFDEQIIDTYTNYCLEKEILSE